MHAKARDAGYLTVTPEFRIEVSSRIQQEYTNGKLYYSYHGQTLKGLPAKAIQRPSGDFLEWHNLNVFAG